MSNKEGEDEEVIIITIKIRAKTYNFILIKIILKQKNIYINL